MAGTSEPNNYLAATAGHLASASSPACARS
jgi:hypothetical protein